MRVRRGEQNSASQKTSTFPKRKRSRRREPSQKKNQPTPSLTEFVGRVGELRLRYAKLDGRTVIAHSYFTTPWKLLPPIYLDDTGAAYTLLINPSGGLVGGDGLSIDMTLDRDAHVLVSAPSANRVYRSEEKLSEQLITVAVGPHAILEWLPEHTIPFAGSRFRQVIHARLAPGAAIILWDALASGRMARGERWAFTHLENEIHITTATGASLVERYILDPATDLGRVGLAEEWDYVASLYVVSDSVSPEVWTSLESKVAEILGKLPGQVLGGVSVPAIPGLAIKLLARTAPDLTHLFELLWVAAREALWNLPPVSLRKY